MTAEQRMRTDWNERARQDAVYWINTIYGKGEEQPTPEAFFADGARWARTLTQPVLDRLGADPHGRTVLEIGCGIGRLFPGFAEIGFERIIGVDVSDEMVTRGRAVCPVPRAEFILGDGYRFREVATESVDFCFSYNVLQHLPSEDILWSNLAEVQRVLRPGGVFQLHLRSHHLPKRRMLRMIPHAGRTAAQIAYRAATFRWLRYGWAGSRVVGTDDTWDLGITVRPARLRQRLKQMGFTEVDTPTDATYADGMRYWAVGRKPAS